MSHFPAEIKYMIAFNLRNCDQNPHGPRDIKQFRLVSTEFSAIGAAYLLPVIHLTFQSKSFERLRTISQHPFYSQHVTRLHYEPDTFDNVLKSEEDLVKENLESKEQEELEPRAAAARSELRTKFKALKVAWSDQMTIRHQIDAYNFGLVASAVARLPNLTEITLSFEDGVVPHTSAFKRAYAETMYLPGGDDDHRDPYGVMQLSSVLYGVGSSETKIKSLDCGRIDWKILSIDEKKMSVIKRALKHLENFRIMFYAGKGYLDTGYFYQELSLCAMFLSNYSMCEFLSAAKELRTLSLYIDESGGGCDLKYMVGTTTWEFLRVFELDTIFTTEETLIEFLKRHAGTLRELGLNNITLLSGCWITALPKIRRAVRLKELRAVGFWLTYHRSRRWDIDTSPNLQEAEESTLSQPCKLGIAVNRYVLEGGILPLLDTIAYPFLP